MMCKLHAHILWKIITVGHGRFGPPGDMWQYPETLLGCHSRGVGVGAAGLQWVLPSLLSWCPGWETHKHRQYPILSHPPSSFPLSLFPLFPSSLSCALSQDLFPLEFSLLFIFLLLSIADTNETQLFLTEHTPHLKIQMVMGTRGTKTEQNQRTTETMVALKLPGLVKWGGVPCTHSFFPSQACGGWKPHPITQRQPLSRSLTDQSAVTGADVVSPPPSAVGSLHCSGAAPGTISVRWLRTVCPRGLSSQVPQTGPLKQHKLIFSVPDPGRSKSLLGYFFWDLFSLGLISGCLLPVSPHCLLDLSMP